MQKLGEDTARIDIMISAELKDEIKKRADEMDLTMSDYLRELATNDIEGENDDCKN